MLNFYEKAKQFLRSKKKDGSKKSAQDELYKSLGTGSKDARQDAIEALKNSQERGE